MTLTAVRRVLELEARVKELEAQRDALQANWRRIAKRSRPPSPSRDARLARLTAGRREDDRAPAPEFPDP